MEPRLGYKWGPSFHKSKHWQAQGNTCSHRAKITVTLWVNRMWEVYNVFLRPSDLVCKAVSQLPVLKEVVGPNPS